MFAFIKWLVVKLAVVRMLWKLLGGLGLFLPLAFLLKLVGLPALMVLGVLALPLLFVLVIIGLPIFLVVAVGGVFLAFLFMALTLGLVALKVALFVVLPIWVVWQVATWIFKKPGDRKVPPPVADEGSGI